MKTTLLILMVLTMLYACGGGQTVPSDAVVTSTSDLNANSSYDPERGEGKFTNVEVPSAINEKLAHAGTKVYEVKCSPCHKLSEEKLVGPGWKGVTERFKPEWIMNFVTNTDAMLDKDPKAQAQLEICLVRMPNQNVSDEDARNVYEFMRKNDSKK